MTQGWAVRLDAGAVDHLLDTDEFGPDYEDLVQGVVDDIAVHAAASAAKASGDGARSIHGEVHRGHSTAAFSSTYQPEDEQPTGYVSWDQENFHMYFVETGTEKAPPRPFLRPSLDSAQI